MEPHRPRPGTRNPEPQSRRPSNRSASRVIDAEWLEQAALRYAAKWETTERGVCEALERKLSARAGQAGRETGGTARGEVGGEAGGQAGGDAAEDVERLRAMIPEIAAGLVARGYVDDRRFAEQLAARLQRQGRSQAYLASKLRTKGVSDEIIEDLLGDAAPEAELQAAWRLARKRRLGPYCLDEEKRSAQRDKHLGALARQGFSLDLATRIIDADAAPEED
ncbi:MAG: regulatory protein RecX [Myxococcota bacterium]